MNWHDPDISNMLARPPLLASFCGRLKINSQLFMFRGAQLLLCAVCMVPLLFSAHRAGAQPAGLSSPGSSAIHIATVITNGNIQLLWQLMPGRWELQIKQPADTGDWKPVPAALYHTNGMMVSATLPLPGEQSLFQLKRLAALSPPGMPPLPAVPPPPTNLPPPLKRPGS